MGSKSKVHCCGKFRIRDYLECNFYFLHLIVHYFIGYFSCLQCRILLGVWLTTIGSRFLWELLVTEVPMIRAILYFGVSYVKSLPVSSEGWLVVFFPYIFDNKRLRNTLSLSRQEMEYGVNVFGLICISLRRGGGWIKNVVSLLPAASNNLS